MKILFIGDSITRGRTGVNWVQHLARKHPEWTIENEGVNGDTLIRIRERLAKKLEWSGSYDVIVLQGGANDILIPALQKRSFLFRKAHERLIKKGYRPLSPGDTEAVLNDMIGLIRQRSKATIIMTTISSMGEDEGLSLNEQRKKINGIITKVANEQGCILADTATLFDQYLQKRRTKTYFLQHFLNTAFLDGFCCTLFNRADAMSRKRGLHLTIDGLHLNSRGGVIWLHEVEKQILGCCDPAWIKACRRS